MLDTHGILLMCSSKKISIPTHTQKVFVWTFTSLTSTPHPNLQPVLSEPIYPWKFKPFLYVHAHMYLPLKVCFYIILVFVSNVLDCPTSI